MTCRTFAARYATLTSLSVWFGGFTFYAAAVVPILHDELDVFQAGLITRRVTDLLNCVGVATLAIWWTATWREPSRASCSRRGYLTRVALLTSTSLLLGFLIILHRVMDQRLDAMGTRGFYPLHRVYLIASTVQWFVHLALFALTALERRGEP